MKKTYRIECFKEVDSYCKKEIKRINSENLIVNGGTLKHEGLLPYDYVLIAIHENKIIGYALLKENFLCQNDIYVMQVAVDKNFQHQGVGSSLYEYAYHYSKGYDYFTASVDKKNPVSQHFHEKCGFCKTDETNLGYNYVKPVTEEVKKSFLDAVPKRYILKNYELSEDKEKDD